MYVTSKCVKIFHIGIYKLPGNLHKLSCQRVFYHYEDIFPQGYTVYITTYHIHIKLCAVAWCFNRDGIPCTHIFPAGTDRGNDNVSEYMYNGRIKHY